MLVNVLDTHGMILPSSASMWPRAAKVSPWECAQAIVCGRGVEHPCAHMKDFESSPICKFQERSKWCSQSCKIDTASSAELPLLKIIVHVRGKSKSISCGFKTPLLPDLVPL